MNNIHGVTISVNSNGTYSVMIDTTIWGVYKTETQAIQVAVALIDQHRKATAR